MLRWRGERDFLGLHVSTARFSFIYILILDHFGTLVDACGDMLWRVHCGKSGRQPLKGSQLQGLLWGVVMAPQLMEKPNIQPKPELSIPLNLPPQFFLHLVFQSFSSNISNQEFKSGRGSNISTSFPPKKESSARLPDQLSDDEISDVSDTPRKAPPAPASAAAEPPMAVPSVQGFARWNLERCPEVLEAGLWLLYQKEMLKRL